MYELMTLPYSYDGLEPDINEEVITFHYTKHHSGYLNRLNDFLKKDNYDYRYSLEEIPRHISEFSLPLRGDILYNVGGVLNHDLYFLSMGKNSSLPRGNLLNRINLQYGNFENFRRDFNERARNLIGSGYTFLVSNDKGDLLIVNMINQETPLSYNLIPLFCIDLWEHAYYLQYKNDRDDYINHFWNKANFDYADSVYDLIVKR